VAGEPHSFICNLRAEIVFVKQKPSLSIWISKSCCSELTSTHLFLLGNAMFAMRGIALIASSVLSHTI
jgi:hypothetical protein